MTEKYMGYAECKKLVEKIEYHELTENMTVCVVTLKGGYEILGRAWRFSGENSIELTRDHAYDNAMDQLWEYSILLKTFSAGVVI